jgi:hypothetical protein
MIKKLIEKEFFHKWWIINRDGKEEFYYPFRWGRHSTKTMHCAMYVDMWGRMQYVGRDGRLDTDQWLNLEFTLMDESHEKHNLLYTMITKELLNE